MRRSRFASILSAVTTGLGIAAMFMGFFPPAVGLGLAVAGMVAQSLTPSVLPPSN